MKNKNKKYTPSLHWAIPEIKPNRGGGEGEGGGRGHEISWGIKERNSMWNF